MVGWSRCLGLAHVAYILSIPRRYHSKVAHNRRKTGANTRQCNRFATVLRRFGINSPPPPLNCDIITTTANLSRQSAWMMPLVAKYNKYVEFKNLMVNNMYLAI